MNIKNRMKIKSRSLYYEIEIFDLSGVIPHDNEDDFIMWLESKAVSCESGLNYEYYSLNDNYKEDIGVRFYVKPVFNNNEQCTII